MLARRQSRTKEAGAVQDPTDRRRVEVLDPQKMWSLAGSRNQLGAEA